VIGRELDHSDYSSGTWGELVERAVRSVLAQTYADLDIIIVDDGSTDDTRERLAVLLEVDQRIRYIRHEKNRGAQAARNSGLQAASGEYVAFLDSDNEWLPQKTEKQLALFTSRSTSPGVVYCGFSRMNSRRQVIHEYVPEFRGQVYRQVLQDWLTDTSTLIVRRKLLEMIGGFDETLRAYHEWDVCIRLARESEFDFVPECLTIYHEHTGPSISKNLMIDATGYQSVVERYKKDITRECGEKIMSRHHLKTARLFVLADQFATAKEYFRKSLQLDPANIKAFLHYGATLLGRDVYKFLYSLRGRKKHKSDRFIQT